MSTPHTHHPTRSATRAYRRPLSAVLTLATAAAAILCIHLGSGGIQYTQAGADRIQSAPTAALEFAPLTDSLELAPARAQARTSAVF